MSVHIDTKRKIRSIPLVDDFEILLSRCMISDQDKEILRMHYIHGYDFRYIGDALGYTERAIKSRHGDALKKISRAL